MHKTLFHKIGALALTAAIAFQSMCLVSVENAFAADYNREDTEVFNFYRNYPVWWSSDTRTMEQYQEQFNQMYAHQKHNIDTTGRMSNTFVQKNCLGGSSWYDGTAFGAGARTATGVSGSSTNVNDPTYDCAYYINLNPKQIAYDVGTSGVVVYPKQYFGIKSDISWGTMETPWSQTPNALPKKLANASYYDFAGYTDNGYFVFELCLPEGSEKLFDDLYFTASDAVNVQRDHIVSPTNGSANGGQITQKQNTVAKRLRNYVEFTGADDTNKWFYVRIPVSDFLTAPDENDTEGWWNNYANKTTRRGVDFSMLQNVGIIWVADDAKDYTADGYNKMCRFFVDNLRFVYIDKPTGFECADTTASTAKLTWFASSTPVHGYEILRKAPGEAEFSSIATVDSQTVSYTDTGLDVNEDYEYKVRGIDDLGGVSPMTAAVTAHTSSVGRPKNFSFTLPGEDEEPGIILAWNAPDYGNYVKYHIYRKTKDGEGHEVAGQDFELITTLDAQDEEGNPVLTYTDRDNLSQYLFYDYYITAEGSDGVISPRTLLTDVFASIIAPPTNLTADVQTGKTVHLTWNGPSNADHYIVYRNGKAVSGNVTETEFTDGLMGDLIYETYYKYTVRAYTAANERSDDSAPRTVFIPNPEKTNYLTLFDDMRNSDFAMSGGTYGGTYETDDQNFISGRKSLKVGFTENVNLPQYVSFKPNNTFDIKSLRDAGALIGFSIYAENEDAIKGAYFGFTSTRTVWDRDDQIKAKETAALPLADYVSDYGNWVYVEIPLEDFPAYSQVIGTTLESPYYNYDYSKVEEMGFYAVTSGTTVPCSFNVDDLAIHKYKVPEVASVMTIGGVVISGMNTQTIPGDTEILKITYNYDMDPETLNPNTVTIKDSEGNSLPLYCEYDADTKTCTVRFLEPLAINSGYSLAVSGAKSSHGVAAAVYSKNFNTDDTQSSGTVTLPDQKVYIENGTSVSGAASTVKIYLGSDTQTANNVVAVDMTVEYTQSIVSLKNGANDVLLDQQLTDLGAQAAVLSANKLGIKSEIKSDSTLKPAGTLAYMTFSPVANGNASLTISGTFTVKEPVTGIMRNMNIAGNAASITVSGYGAGYAGGGSGSGGGGGSSSIGGARPNVTATPAPPAPSNDDRQPSGADNLTDINDAAWAADSIKYLFDKKIVSGYADGSFGPNKAITREEFVTMLVNAFNLSDEEAAAEFSDVDTGAWYYKFLASAYAKGIISGIDDEHFGVGDFITREQMCAILYRTIEKCDLKTKQVLSENEFADDGEISEYAKKAVSYLYMLKVISGMGDNMFVPGGEVTRAMACRVIYETLMNNEEASRDMVTGGTGTTNNE